MMENSTSFPTTQLNGSSSAFEASSGPLLVPYRNKSAQEDSAPYRPPSIWQLLRHQSSISARLTPKYCGRYPINGSVDIKREEGTGNLHVSGLKMCRSNMCVVCSLQKQRETQEKWLELLLKSRVAGYRIVFCVLTLRTSPKVSNKKALEVLKEATGRLLRKPWRKPRGIVGYLRAFEATFNLQNGKANPHQNICLIVEDNQEVLERLHDDIASRWRNLIIKIDPEHVPSLEKGVFSNILESKEDIERVSSYASKLGLEDKTSKEALFSFSKVSAGVNPRQLLQRSYDGDERATKLFQHWQSLISSMRRYATSRGLKALLQDVVLDPQDFEEKCQTQAKLSPVLRLESRCWSIVWAAKMLPLILDKLRVASKLQEDLLRKLVFCCEYEVVTPDEFLFWLRKWLVYQDIKT